MGLRLVCVGLLLGVGLVAVIYRTASLSIVDHDKLRTMSEKQHRRTIHVTPRRGDIVDRRGVELAVSLEVESVFGRPSEIDNTGEVARIVAARTGQSERVLLNKLHTNKPFVWLARSLAPAQTAPIREQGLRGVGFARDYRRFYPHRQLAAHMMGFVGVDGDGLEGLERSLNEKLRGQDVSLIGVRDARGRLMTPVDDAGALPASRGREGHTVELTIDAVLQHIVEEEVADAVVTHKAKRGMAILQDPMTGEILAGAVYPTFDINKFSSVKPQVYRDALVTDIFEPGSTFKVFLVAAALDSGIVSPTTPIFCEEGAYEVKGSIINDTHPYGWLPVREVVIRSSNIGAAKLGRQLDREALDHYIRAFGFGSKTELGLPGESKGIVRNTDKISEVGIATISFGQGISVTPVQMVNALSTIANGGMLMQPSIVRSVTSRDGEVISEFTPTIRERVISPDSARKVTNILTGVVEEEGGTGSRAAIPGYQIAGKTGTAQKVDTKAGGYLDDTYIGSFMGFAPSNNPRLSLIVILDEPEGRGYGGVVAAPAFSHIMARSLAYLGVPPDREVQVDASVNNTNAVEGNLDMQALELALQDERNMEEEYKPATFTAPDAKPEGAIGAVGVPDFWGMSKRKVLAEAARAGLRIESHGAGWAISQDPPAGSQTEPGLLCRVNFAPPF